jgi:hypothetical protein
MQRCPLCNHSATFTLQRTRPLTATDRVVSEGLSNPGDVLEIRGCPRCGMLFRAPRPSAEVLAAYYSSLPSREGDLMDLLGVSRDRGARRNASRHAASFDALRRIHGNGPGHVVDIGGGDGAALSPWRAAGWRTTLVDPGVELRGAGGNDVVPSVSALAGTAVDVVTSYHCIEHMADVGASLKEMSEVSRKGALWCVEVPHEVPTMAGLLGDAPMDPTFHVEHLNFFTPQALRFVGHVIGLRDVRVDTVVSTHWHGPSVGLRMVGIDDGGAPHQIRDSYRDSAQMRTALRVLMPAWRLESSLKFRWFRARGLDPAPQA